MKVFIRNPKVLCERPQAVLFDTDNTLYNYAPAHLQAMAETRVKACQLLGVSPGEFDAAFEEARRQIKKRLGCTASSHSRLLYFQRMIELLGMKTQLLMTLDLEQTYWRTFLTTAELFGGLQDFLEDLRVARVHMAIISDLTAQIQFRKLIHFGLESYFDYVVTSEEAGQDKPASQGFLLAIEKLGIKSDRLWMIGDDPVTDMEGAKRSLNAVTLQKSHDGVVLATGDYAPDAVFEDFDDLRQLFRSLPV